MANLFTTAEDIRGFKAAMRESLARARQHRMLAAMSGAECRAADVLYQPEHHMLMARLMRQRAADYRAALI